MSISYWFTILFPKAFWVAHLQLLRNELMMYWEAWATWLIGTVSHRSGAEYLNNLDSPCPVLLCSFFFWLHRGQVDGKFGLPYFLTRITPAFTSLNLFFQIINFHQLFIIELVTAKASINKDRPAGYGNALPPGVAKASLLGLKTNSLH